MASLQRFKEEWLRPFFFYGNNRISLIGGAITTASAFVLIGYWIISFIGRGGPHNIYVSLIFIFCVPVLFIIGLLVIALGIWLHHRHLRKADQIPENYPEIDLNDPIFRRGVVFVLVATFVNFIVVGTAAYRGVDFMDQPSFCGTSCHVMKPEWVAYHHSPFHRHVACVECHIAPGVPGYISAKESGVTRVWEVTFGGVPRPIMPGNKIPPAHETCQRCHNPDRYIGNVVVVKNSYGNDKKNTLNHTVLVMHVGGRNAAGVYSGIHGAHYSHRIEYRATSPSHQTIPWVEVIDSNGKKTIYKTSGYKKKNTDKPQRMGCTDCHSRPAHSFRTASGAIDHAMSAGLLKTDLPYLHKEGLKLIQASYKSQAQAGKKIPAALDSYYKSNYSSVWKNKQSEVKAAGKQLVAAYDRNVYPFMNLTWGTHPNDLGHMNYTGCFRCHDGSHVSKSGKAIPNSCTLCHNMVAVDSSKPKVLKQLGMIASGGPSS